MLQPAKPLAVAGIVLAAGASRRMGQNKMFVRFEGETLLRRAARIALAARLSPVVVVLGHDIETAVCELDDLDCMLALNRDFTGPTSGSFHAALHRLPPDTAAAVVLLADMVFISSDILRDLVTCSIERGADLVVSRYGGVVAPPLLFRRTLFPELLAWTGDGCGKVMADRHPEDVAFLDWPEVLLTDIDTPDDLHALHQQANTKV